MKRSILYVDDELDNLLVFEAAFEDDFIIQTANSGKEALEILEKEAIPVVVADQRMPGMSGTEFLAQAKQVYPDAKKVLLTAYADTQAAITSINAPILGNFGSADRGIPADDVKKFGAALTQYGKLGDIKIYEGAGHAFMNPNNKEGYDAAAAQDAWGRIDRFFDRTLRATISNS